MTDRTAVNSVPAQRLEGALAVPKGARFAIVASRFNSFVVDRLVEGALDALIRHGATGENIILVRVPGSWEVPLVCSRFASSGKVDAVIAISAVIRGGTPHFDYIAAEAAKGVASVSLRAGIPVSFGVLTTDTIEQAIDRAGTKSGNKGFDAAMSAVEMVSLGRQLKDAGF